MIYIFDGLGLGECDAKAQNRIFNIKTSSEGNLSHVSGEKSGKKSI